jgi:phosphoserine phosphatase RsbX
MDPRAVNDLGFLQVAEAGHTMPGEGESGDIGVVARVPDGALLAVIDGLGHGPEAARAAEAAAATVHECAGEPLMVVMEHCHRTLRGTRGVVITLAQVDEHRDVLSWVGVGNVEGRIWPAVPGDTLTRQAPPLRGGVVGHHLPRLTAATLPLTRGDLMILSTDGIKHDFHDRFRLTGTVQQIADDIADDYWVGKDDALVLVARYLGSS